MRPPSLLVLTDRTQCSRPLPDVVASAVEHGARGVVLREKDLPQAERDALARELRALLEPVGGLLIRAGWSGSVAGRAGEGATRGAVREPVHLSAVEPFPSPRPEIVGRSCHSPAELSRAAEEGCDYAFLSPVFPTPSKPGYGPVLGIEGFARLLVGDLPSYALGGIRPESVRVLLAAGAAGVAVMGPVMRRPELVAAYCAQLATGESGH